MIVRDRTDDEIDNMLMTIQRIKGDPAMEGKMWVTIVKQLSQECGHNISADTARGIWRRHKHKLNDVKPESAKPEDGGKFHYRAARAMFTDKVTPENLSLEEMLAGFTQAQEFRGNFNIAQVQADVEIKATKPIAVSWLTDMHIGSPYTDYDAIYKDVVTIRDHPQLYACLGGDTCDNFMPGFRDAAAVVNQLHPAQVQLLGEEKIIDALGEKLLAENGGNHNDMPTKRTGIDAEYFILRDKAFPVMPFGGLLVLKVGEVEYKILWKHSYRFKSSLNLFNSHHRMLEILEPTADIVVQEHEHNPGIETIERHEFDSRKTVVNIRTGSYKISDPFSLRYYKSGRMGPQTVIFYPDRRKVVPMHGREAIDDAVIYLRGVK